MSLKGVSIPNDSYVDINDIGEGDNALLCCCSKSRTGEWYFPNGSQVEIQGTRKSHSNLNYFYRNRLDSTHMPQSQQVRLNRIKHPPESGRFRCEVQSLSGNTLHEIIVIIGM